VKHFKEYVRYQSNVGWRTISRGYRFNCYRYLFVISKYHT